MAMAMGIAGKLRQALGKIKAPIQSLSFVSSQKVIQRSPHGEGADQGETEGPDKAEQIAVPKRHAKNVSGIIGKGFIPN